MIQAPFNPCVHPLYEPFILLFIVVIIYLLGHISDNVCDRIHFDWSRESVLALMLLKLSRFSTSQRTRPTHTANFQFKLTNTWSNTHVITFIVKKKRCIRI
jgi:hypothetical protein